MKNKFLYLTVALGMMLGFSSCDLDTFPSDELNSDLLLQDSKGAEYIMDGCYAVLKDEVEFLGYSSGNTYVRHYFQMSEFPADNICLSAHTTDALYEATAYMMTDGLKNVGTLWMVAYKVIYMTNTVIETLDSTNVDNKQLLGEAYFMRGLMHLHLATLFAMPYSFGTSNLGIPLRTS
ncbi:MAG: RagB/SusD family nutrient uptake outer membrane protein, partial [Paludibacteraceae bacterium]|nr:RagB/SusD family nutrient uptake outer membrane protein [Paludibacteraceae bacterium]